MDFSHRCSNIYFSISFINSMSKKKRIIAKRYRTTITQKVFDMNIYNIDHCDS